MSAAEQSRLVSGAGKPSAGTYQTVVTRDGARVQWVAKGQKNPPK